MQEQLISFETAKLAREKGFDIECLHFYTKPQSKMFGIDEHGRSYPIKNKSKSLYVIGEHATLNIESVFYAPTQSLLQKWLREAHNIHLVIKPRFKGDLNNPIVDYSYNGEKGDRNNIFYPTYEEALEIGLQEALKLI